MAAEAKEDAKNISIECINMRTYIDEIPEDSIDRLTLTDLVNKIKGGNEMKEANLLPIIYSCIYNFPKFLVINFHTNLAPFL